MNNDKPICETDEDGTKRWFLNGKRHRIDDPAVEYADGYKAWYINGEEIEVTTQEQFDIFKGQRDLDKEFPTFECKPTIWSKVVKRIKYELTGNELYSTKQRYIPSKD